MQVICYRVWCTLLLCLVGQMMTDSWGKLEHLRAGEVQRGWGSACGHSCGCVCERVWAQGKMSVSVVAPPPAPSYAPWELVALPSEAAPSLAAPWGITARQQPCLIVFIYKSWLTGEMRRIWEWGQSPGKGPGRVYNSHLSPAWLPAGCPTLYLQASIALLPALRLAAVQVLMGVSEEGAQT